jgi:hypothetical protein
MLLKFDYPPLLRQKREKMANITFHKSRNIVIATHMNHLQTPQKLHIYVQ